MGTHNTVRPKMSKFSTLSVESEFGTYLRTLARDCEELDMMSAGDGDDDVYGILERVVDIGKQLNKLEAAVAFAWGPLLIFDETMFKAVDGN